MESGLTTIYTNCSWFHVLFRKYCSGGSKGVAGDAIPVSVQFLSFWCSFRQKSLQNNRFLHTPVGLVPPLGNLGSATELEKHRCWRIRHWNSSYYQIRRKYYAKMLFNRIGNSENIANLSWRLWFFLLTHCCIKAKYKTYEFVVSNVFSVLRQSIEATD